MKSSFRTDVADPIRKWEYLLLEDDDLEDILEVLHYFYFRVS